MDDMKVFERQIADESLRIVGPSRPVNEAAIFTAITATQSPKWRFQTMFSATKFVVAGAIVALFGGFLLAGMLTQPNEVPAPAASTATASPSAEASAYRTTPPDATTRSDLLPGVDLVTEEVERGVLRLVNDGHRDLTVMLTPVPGPGRNPEDARRAATNLVAGLDGSVWVFGPDESYRVGQRATYPATEDSPSFPWQKAEVDPGGRLWTLVGSDAETSALRSFGGGSWQTERDDVVAFDLEQDGTVWVNADDRFIRLRDGWQTPQFARDVEDFWLSPVMHGTQVPGDEIEVLVQTREMCLECGLAVWLLQEDGDTHGGPAGMVPAQLDAVDMDEDGDWWIYQHLDVPLPGPGVTETVAPTRTLEYVVHVTGPTFTVYSDAEGVPKLGGWGSGVVFRAARDGSVWLTPSACDGLARFDGEVWLRYLSGRCVYGFDFGPDGTVWVQAASPHGQGESAEPEPFPVDTFVIRPEVAASTG